MIQLILGRLMRCQAGGSPLLLSLASTPCRLQAPQLPMQRPGSTCFSTSTQPQAGADDDAQHSPRHQVFMGTADMHTRKPAEEVATDANRNWMSPEDLGTRAQAALGTTQAAAQDSSQEDSTQEGGMDSSQAAQDEQGDDDACHPADPYCTAGEEPPRADDFHEEGDGTTPPSAGFPA